MEVTSRELGEKRLDKVSKQSMEYGGREVNHSKAGLLRVVGKALHMMESLVQ